MVIKLKKIEWLRVEISHSCSVKMMHGSYLIE